MSMPGTLFEHHLTGWVQVTQPEAVIKYDYRGTQILQQGPYSGFGKRFFAGHNGKYCKKQTRFR
jgi:hypothetical protein